jgi:hypothetical protein
VCLERELRTTTLMGTFSISASACRARHAGRNVPIAITAENVAAANALAALCISMLCLLDDCAAMPCVGRSRPL